MRTYTWDEYYEKFYDWAESTRLNMGNRIAFHDIYGDGFLTNWSVQKRIKQMLQAIETAYNEVQLLRNKL